MRERLGRARGSRGDGIGKTAAMVVGSAIVGLIVGDIHNSFGVGDWIEDRFGRKPPCPIENRVPSTGEASFLSADAVVVVEGDDEGASGREINFTICKDKDRESADFSRYWYWGTNADGEPILFPLGFDEVNDDWSGHGFLIGCPEGRWIIPQAGDREYEFSRDEC